MEIEERGTDADADGGGEAPALPSVTRPVVSHDVLYVDDDPQELRALQRLLNREDCHVYVALGPASALQALGEREFAVIMADFGMPEMDGIKFLEQAARIQPDAPRMLVTAEADFETALRAVNRVGIFRFVPKPWNGTHLRASVRQALLHHRYVRENQSFASRLEAVNHELMDVNRRLDATVAERTAEMLLSLCNALDLRDTDTQWHSRRVALYSRRLAEEVGLMTDELRDIERGALLHDIGKIGVSDTILLKPSKLTEEEWRKMREHSELGAKILSGIPFLDRARRLVREHHERWDGKGYAQGLREGQIYVGARIFAVIDTYDAMTSDRPYRKGMDHDIAVEEIRRNSGTQFDPEIVGAFCNIPDGDIEAARARASEPDATAK